MDHHGGLSLLLLPPDRRGGVPYGALPAQDRRGITS